MPLTEDDQRELDWYYARTRAGDAKVWPVLEAGGGEAAPSERRREALREGAAAFFQGVSDRLREDLADASEHCRVAGVAKAVEDAIRSRAWATEWGQSETFAWAGAIERTWADLLRAVEGVCSRPLP